MTTHIKQLEKVVDLLINEDKEQASELLHQIFIQKARAEYSRLVESEMLSDEEEGLEEEIGGDMKGDFAQEIEADMGEINADEQGIADDSEVSMDDELPGEEETPQSFEEVGDELKELEGSLNELWAQFSALKGEEMEEPNHEDLEDKMHDASAEVKEEGLVAEALEMDKVAATGQEKEGKLVGTGAKSKTGTVDKDSLFTKETAKVDVAGKPVSSKNGKEGDHGDLKAKEMPASQKPELKKAPEAVKVPKGEDKGAVSTLTKVKGNVKK